MSGDYIRAARKMRHMTQLALAEKLGRDQSDVSHWERGTRTPNADRLREIADALNVSMDSLWPSKNQSRRLR